MQMLTDAGEKRFSPQNKRRAMRKPKLREPIVKSFHSWVKLKKSTSKRQITHFKSFDWLPPMASGEMGGGGWDLRHATSKDKAGGD